MNKRAAALLAIGLVIPSSHLSVAERNGNIYLLGTDGRAIQLTATGLDSDPSLSGDGRLVVFVRRTPQRTLPTAGRDTDRNELWIASTEGTDPARPVLVGQSGPDGIVTDYKYGLQGFRRPQFSLDAKRIYFMGIAAATTSPAFVLDLETGRVRLLYEGSSIEVIDSGRYAGYLIALKYTPRVVPPAGLFRYWLLDADGKEIGEIADEADQESLQNFKSSIMK